MNENVRAIYNPSSDIWGLPQVYKTISFYPIKVKDQIEQNLLYKIFAQPKQYINKKEITIVFD